MINNNKYLGAALATLAVAGLVAAPQASAKTKKAAAPVATVSKTEVLEAQLRAMQDEIAALRAQVNATAPSATVAATVAADSKKVQELDDWAASVKAKHAETHHAGGGNMLYFRGGYSGNDQSMAATTNSVALNNGQVATLGNTGHRDGWNFGAGIDFKLNDNMFGLVDKTELLGELDLNYVDLGTFTAGAISTVANGALSGGQSLSGPVSNTVQATQSMLRISASPKIKFLQGSKIRPWLIPVGFTLNVISPPSQANAITELKPAMNFGTGVDYNVWKSLYIGADVRYFLATESLNGTNVNGLTAGGTLGFGF